MATKILNFYSYNLQKDTTVMLMFNPPNSSKLYRNQFPVVWKIMTFHAGKHARAAIHYNPRLAFGHAQIDDNNIVNSASWVEFKSGDITSITGANENKRPGSVNKQEDSKLLVCKNDTDYSANMSIGLIKGDGAEQHFDPTLLWTGVGAKSNIVAQFTPVLYAYVTRDYNESQCLRGEVETDAIWAQDLNLLDDVSSWNFREDDESGTFFIEKAGSV